MEPKKLPKKGIDGIDDRSTEELDEALMEMGIWRSARARVRCVRSWKVLSHVEYLRNLIEHQLKKSERSKRDFFNLPQIQTLGISIFFFFLSKQILRDSK